MASYAVCAQAVGGDHVASALSVACNEGYYATLCFCLEPCRLPKRNAFKCCLLKLLAGIVKISWQRDLHVFRNIMSFKKMGYREISRIITHSTHIRKKCLYLILIFPRRSLIRSQYITKLGHELCQSDPQIMFIRGW